MTTAIFRFGAFNVYADNIGAPAEASNALMQALDYAHVLPKYQPGEFACAFIAANKPQPRVVAPAHVGYRPQALTGAGGLQLVSLREVANLIDNVAVDNIYEIVQSEANDYLIVYAYDTQVGSISAELFFRGPIHYFAREYGPPYLGVATAS